MFSYVLEDHGGIGSHINSYLLTLSLKEILGSKRNKSLFKIKGQRPDCPCPKMCLGRLTLQNISAETLFWLINPTRKITVVNLILERVSTNSYLLKKNE